MRATWPKVSWTTAGPGRPSPSPLASSAHRRPGLPTKCPLELFHTHLLGASVPSFPPFPTAKISQGPLRARSTQGLEDKVGLRVVFCLCVWGFLFGWFVFLFCNHYSLSKPKLLGWKVGCPAPLLVSGTGSGSLLCLSDPRVGGRAGRQGGGRAC